MRMWMVDPKILCRKHLLGEHLELHMFAGALKKGISMTGYVTPVTMLEPEAILSRHDMLMTEMELRGYKHKSPLTEVAFAHLPTQQKRAKVNTLTSYNELMRRCPECKKRAQLYNIIME